MLLPPGVSPPLVSGPSQHVARTEMQASRLHRDIFQTKGEVISHGATNVARAASVLEESLMSKRSAQMKRRQRAAAGPSRGQSSLAEQIQSVAPKLTPFQAGRVRPTTQKSYIQAVQLLLVYMVVRTLPTYPAEVWDQILPEYLEFLYDKGIHRSTGT